jgi:hypothetical protein
MCVKNRITPRASRKAITTFEHVIHNVQLRLESAFESFCKLKVIDNLPGDLPHEGKNKIISSVFDNEKIVEIISDKEGITV